MRKTTLLLALLALVAFAPAVDAQSARTDGTFVYDPSAQPKPPEDGDDDCPPSTIINSTPFNDTGDTCGNTNTITTYSGTCTLPFPYGGEDQVYGLTVGGGANINISADLTGSTGDLALFIVGTCGDGSTCVANSQDSIGPGAGPEEILGFSAAVGNYFLYVDSYYNAGSPGSCGTFDLDVTGTIPAELVEFEIH